jgi:hypothetical protein
MGDQGYSGLTVGMLPLKKAVFVIHSFRRDEEGKRGNRMEMDWMGMNQRDANETSSFR